MVQYAVSIAATIKTVPIRVVVSGGIPIALDKVGMRVRVAGGVFTGSGIPRDVRHAFPGVWFLDRFVGVISISPPVISYTGIDIHIAAFINYSVMNCMTSSRGRSGRSYGSGAVVMKKSSGVSGDGVGYM